MLTISPDGLVAERTPGGCTLDAGSNDRKTDQEGVHPSYQLLRLSGC